MAKVKLLDPSDSRRKLDRYELIGEIAAGGMATVFLGRLAGVGGFQRFVAIKRLHPHLAHEEEFVEMFLDEARLAAGIHHPHVVPILEVGTSDAGYYLVMEYIEGDTLARLMARSATSNTPVPRAILLKILLDSLAGLHAAHELHDADDQPVGLVHRDVSPQNLLVGMDGSSRITDFGVARANARLTSTAAGTMKGKLAYMAPEQTNGSDLDRRADLFAMGIILWEMLAGKRLFKADSEATTLKRVLSDPIPRVKSVVANIPDALDEVCAKSLERDLSLRFQTAAEMADALERAGRDSAKTAGETMIASPREVAAYVQKVIGQDISAQRESVRAWLAHSEPSSSMGIPRAPQGRDSVTGKLALARPSRPGEAPAQSPPLRTTAADLPAARTPPSEAGDDEPPSSQDEDALTQMRSGTSLSSASMTLQQSDAARSTLASPDPISFADGVPKARSKKALLAIPFLLLLLVGGFFVWSKAGVSHVSSSGEARSSSSPVVASPAPSAAPSAAPVLSAQPQPAAAIDAGVIASPSALPNARAPLPPGAGKPRPPSAPTSTPTADKSTPPPAVPAKPAGDDLSNPYR